MKIILVFMVLWGIDASAAPKEEDPHLSYWASVFAAPSHTWRAELEIANYQWDQVVDHEPNASLRLAGGWRDGGWIGAEVSARISWRNSQSGPLQVTNTMSFLGAQAGVERWFGGLRLAALGGGGLLLRTSELQDDLGTVYDATRFGPWGGTRFCVGVAVKEHVYVGGSVDLMFRPHAMDWSLGFGVGWLF